VLAGVSTYIGTATSDGTITVPITDDPLIVVVTTKPDEPTSVVATAGEDRQSVVSWSAPIADGGSPITSYTVTSSGGQTCSSATTTCTVTSLNNGSSYTFTVKATNLLGVGAQSTASASITVGTTPSGGGGNSPAQEPAPTVEPKVVSNIDTATVQAALVAEKKAEREKLQIKVARDQKTYLELFSSVTTVVASSSALISNQKSGTLLNTKNETIDSSQSAILKISAQEISLSGTVVEELKTRAKITVSTAGVSVTPVAGFTGLLVVPVVGIVDGVETVVLNKIVVNPEPPVARSFGPTSINQSSIAWAPSTSQTVGYVVTVNGKKICQTAANICPIAQLIGPKSVVTITALGNDQTASEPVVIPYSATTPIPALKVNFAVGSSILSQAQQSEIRSIARVIKDQGFTRLVVHGFTDSTGSAKLNKSLSAARANSVAVFMRKLLPQISIKASAFGPKKPVASNNSKFGQSQNRRTEISTW
jgi:outer membrane protein OmpA-like peptidoglycan-associated protein